MTDEEVELEIDRLWNLPTVKLAQREQRCKYQRRQYLYALRWYEKRGKQLMEQGMTFADFKAMSLDDESAGKENKSWTERKAQEKDHNAWLKQRKKTATALNEEAFELRSAFVRGFRVSTKAQLTDLFDRMFNEVMNWKSFTGYSYYRSGWDSNLLRRMLAIPCEPDRDKEETFKHELERRRVHRASFLLAWALCGGIVPPVQHTDGYCNPYNGGWKPCEDLDDAYWLLIGLGYPMSDFEKSLQDKTHEFFNAPALLRKAEAPAARGWHPEDAGAALESLIRPSASGQWRLETLRVSKFPAKPETADGQIKDLDTAPPDWKP